ncbi:YegP family protein [Luteolibacter soli]|uniref:YegP family protein n=1 Tax=Luteolibacter soli TaxID=3135280 RepID=A0ABU9AUK9_9BACT
MAQGYYKLKGGASCRFTLLAANHEVILTSQSYDSKAGAEGGIESVRKNGPDAKNYEKKTSSAKQPYFVLKAGNGQIIGTSEMYTSEAGRDNGIASVQANSASTTVKEE